MHELIFEAKEKINEILNSAYRKAMAEGLLPEGELNGTVEIPKDTANGDFAANHAMVGAKAFHKAPKQIAEILVSNADLEGSWFSSCESAGPGFINFRLAPQWYADVINAVKDAGKDYGRINAGNGSRVMVEFVSANPTGPMHMGNARGGVLGDALASVLDYAGYNSYREFYVNDTGNQIDIFAKSIDFRYHQQILGWKDEDLPDEYYHGDDIRELAAEFRKEFGDFYLEDDETARHEKMAEFGLNHNIPKMQSDLERYGIQYDKWFFESSLHESGFVADTISRLTELGYTYEKDGALWLKTTELVPKCEKDDVLRRANGFYTYFAADIAYHRNKLETRGFDRVINIWGADHHGHVARLKGALDALGLDGQHRLDIVLMQLVKLMANGEEVRMSKRTGKMISLSNLLDDISVDAARFFFNSRPESPVVFDLELAKRQDSENPVYYVQYAHARICTMLSNLALEGYNVPDKGTADLSLLTEDAEKELIKQIAMLPEEVRTSAKDLDPSKISSYATELATKFHKFYTVCRIKGAEDELLKARLALTDAARTALENALSIIGVSAPDKM